MVCWQHAYVGLDIKGFCVVDVSNPQTPKKVGAIESGAEYVAVAGNYAYVTYGEGGKALGVVDVSDPKRPKELSGFGTWITGNVAVQGKYVYLASGNLYVLDVSRPAEPKEVGFYDTEQDPCNFAWRVAVAGEYVFVAGGGEHGFSILRAHWAHQPGAPPPKP